MYDTFGCAEQLIKPYGKVRVCLISLQFSSALFVYKELFWILLQLVILAFDSPDSSMKAQKKEAMEIFPLN